MRLLATRAAFAAVSLAALATAHGDDESMDMDMGMNMHNMHTHTTPSPTASAHAHNQGPMSYFAYGKHSSTILAHIALMVLGWCFVLPAGKRNPRRERTFQN